MKTGGKLLFILVIPTFFALLIPSAGAQDARASIRAEIARVQEDLRKHPIADADLKEINSMVADGTQSAAAALSSGRIYLSLEKLGQAEDLLQGGRRADDKAEV